MARAIGAKVALFLTAINNLTDGKGWHTLDGHRGAVDSLEFSTDGQLLLSKSQDTTALVWNLSGLSREGTTRAPDRLSPRQFDALGADLAGEDAAKAYPAILALAAVKDTAPLLQERLIAMSRPYPQRREQIKQLIAALNNDHFREREQATEGLQRMRDDAEPWLRQALASNVSPEVSRRVRDVLEGMRGTSPGPETLRVLRTIEVLEIMATPEARDALQRLAEGVPEFRLTQEAQASLQRMSKLREGSR